MSDSQDSDDSDELVEDTHEPANLVLLFTCEGKAELLEDDEPVWFSDDDEDFAQQFGDQLFLEAEEDAAEVIEYLLDAGLITEPEKSDIDVQEEIDGDNVDEQHADDGEDEPSLN